MANKKVSLYWRCLTANGWKRLPVIIGKNNRIRHTHVMIDGVEVIAPQGVYELRTYDGTKTIWTAVGTDPVSALLAAHRQGTETVARVVARAAGLSVSSDTDRIDIAVVGERYVEDCGHRQANEAKLQARLVVDEFKAVFCKRYLDEITREDIYRFHEALRKRGCGDRTVSNKHMRLKSFLIFAGFNVRDKAIFPPPPKFVKNLPEVYSGEQVAAILAAADPYMKLMIELGLKLGLRDGEMSHAEWSDVDWSNRIFRVRNKPQLGFTVKDKEERDIPISPSLYDSLKLAVATADGKRFIVGTARDLPNTKLLRTLKRLAKANGLNCNRCDGCKSTNAECEQWYLHKLRATYATNLLRSGADLTTVQRYMGHSDITTTSQYLRPVDAHSDQARKLTSALDDWYQQDSAQPTTRQTIN